MNIKYEDFGVVKSCRATTLPSRLWFVFKVAHLRQLECQKWEDNDTYKQIALDYSAKAMEEISIKLLKVDSKFREWATGQTEIDIVELAKKYIKTEEVENV